MCEIKNYIDALFKDYQDGDEINDFKDEISSHLSERISTLKNIGMSEKTAFDKATGELGDISSIADGIAKKKKQEVLSQMYMNNKKYITPKRSALYVLSGFMLLFAVAMSAMTWFAAGMEVAAVASSLPFLMLGVLGLVFLILTQETVTLEPMSTKRALWYVLAVGVLLFGLISAAISYFGVSMALKNEMENSAPNSNLAALAAVSVLFVIALPALALLAFLIMSEKERTKKWAVNILNETESENIKALKSRRKNTLIGLAVWLTALTSTLAIMIASGIKYAWIPLPLALAAHFLLAGVSRNN